jgi:hypothetical protein
MSTVQDQYVTLVRQGATLAMVDAGSTDDVAETAPGVAAQLRA